MMLDSPENDKNKNYLAIINRASRKIELMINDMIKNHHSDFQPSYKYSLHSLIDEILLVNSDRLLIKNITVTKRYANENFKTLGNRSRIFIALSNIIINAIDAIDKISGEIKLSTELSVNGFVIRIEDNGCGIGPAHLARLAEPYFTTKKNGLGTGLTATYAILNASHVKIDVHSEIGKGTRFTLLFPQ